MKRLYSILAILLLTACGGAAPEALPTPRPTIPIEWLTRPPTPAVTAALAGQAPTSESPAPATSPTAVPSPISPAPSPTAESLLDTLFGGDEPASRPLTITTMPGVPAELVAAAQELTAGQPDTWQWLPPGDETADITLTIDDGQPVAQWVYVLAAPFAETADESTLAELGDVWTSLSAPQPQLIVTADEASTLSVLWGAPGPGLDVVPDEVLRETLWAERPSRTILPFHQLTPDLKVLALEGNSPLAGDFDPAAYPLTVNIAARGEETAVAQFRDAWAGPPSNFDPQKMTTVALTGVTALVRATATQMELDGILTPARDVGPLLRAADFAHISNEVSFAADCPEPNPIGGTTFCSQDDYFALLTELGTDIVELTGNHLNDWGAENLARTMEMYEQAGMRTFGGGRDAAEAALPLLLEHNGNRIALVGCNYFGPTYAWATEFSPGSAVCGPDFLPQITRLKEEGYIVLATQQYTEYYQYPPLPDQQADFRAIAAAGADAVSGSQGHHAQGFEFADGSFIHYGLGNLFFDQMDMRGTREALVDTYTVYDGRLLNVSVWTGLIENYFLPREMTAEERAQTLQTLFQASGW